MRRFLSLTFLLIPGLLHAQEKPLPQDGDYAPAMKKIAAACKGNPGVVLHIGDSITYSNPYGQWARHGQGQSDADKAILKWMHANKEDNSDGWYLARFDHPAGNRSHTACSGIRLDEMLRGGTRGMPSLEKILDTYKPQLVVFMLGTNDASAMRKPDVFKKDYLSAVDAMLSRGIVPIVSTIPPHPSAKATAQAFNEAIRAIAKEKNLPLIDYEKEILTRRPNDWNGTLLGKNDVHPTAAAGEINSASAPTAENLKSCGYLLRGWLSVKKIAEVKEKVLDKLPVAEPPKPMTPPGKAMVLPVNRDNWFSNVGTEADGNNGGSGRLKVKSIQEMSIVDLDPTSLKGMTITGATLHVKNASAEILHRVTVSSFGAEWVEGTASGYQPQPGSSTFKHRRHPDVPWTIPGSDLCAVMMGQGGTLWRMADAQPPDAQGWQVIPVDPKVVAARVAGISYGFLIFDDIGSEWSRNGEKLTRIFLPNRFLHSRESGKQNAPFFTIYVGGKDETPPAAPGGFRFETGDLPAGEALVSWLTPKDTGSGTAGFFVSVNGAEIPRYLIPSAGKAGERVTMHLRDLGLKPGGTARVEVRAVDGAGNVGASAATEVVVSTRVAADLPGEMPKTAAAPAKLPQLGSSEIAILDELDKVHPVSGDMIPKQPPAYLSANHLWNAGEGRIKLHSAKNEFIAFQILLRGPAAEVTPAIDFEKDAGFVATFRRYQHVNTKKGPLPDPLVPLGKGLTIPEGQKYGSIHCEIYVPHTARAGDHAGELVLQAGGQTLKIKIALRVWDFTLPDQLSFIAEMNGYGLPGPESPYYRLGHAHRTSLNIVPYSQSGHVHDGWAPQWNGKSFSWNQWDERFGPYFDGSAFNDLPRKGVPLDIFYLPLHENWPSPIEQNYNGDYWADRAFTKKYRADFVEASRQFAEHFNAKHWNDTLFQGFLNNKIDFKQNGWSRGSAPWLFDEPYNHQDFWALRYFATAFHEGVKQAPGKAKLVFRADISRPMWQRDTLDGLLDYNVVSGSFRSYRRMVLDRKRADGQIVLEYGGSNDIEESNIQPLGWCVDAWAIGADGVLPWLVIGSEKAWQQAESTSLFYPPRQGEREPTPSVRLKAFRRGQQDVEYLTLLGLTTKEPRWAVGQKVREALKLAGVRQGTGFTGGEDAGIVTYAKLLPQDVWALRVRIGEALSKAKPPAKRKLVDLRTPPRDLANVEGRLVGE